MSFEQLIEKIKDLPEDYFEDVSLYLESIKKENSSKRRQDKTKFKSLVGKIDIDEDVILKGRECSLV